MKVIFINKTDITGGAAIAAFRLFHIIKAKHPETKMLVQQKKTDTLGIYATSHTGLKKMLNFGLLALEKLVFFFYEKTKLIRFDFSYPVLGDFIAHKKMIRQADIIHIHWINQGYLSMRQLKKLFRLNKPIIWTMHDMWSFTGGCHYAGDCDNYKYFCGYCPYLKKPHKNDLSSKLLLNKEEIYFNTNLTVVGCSKWMARSAKNSYLLKSFRIESIPNPIDTDVFIPIDKKKAREFFNLPQDKKLILFGAANVFDKRKGLKELYYSIEILRSRHTDINHKIELVLFGKAKQKLDLPYNIHYVQYLEDEQTLVKLYNAADCFVLPSLEDNLPNTVVESMSCGTPVVAFDTGGIPEMIKHKVTGYISELGSSSDLADGLYWQLFEADIDEMSVAARDFVLKNYSTEVVGKMYLDLYQDVLLRNQK